MKNPVSTKYGWLDGAIPNAYQMVYYYIKPKFLNIGVVDQSISKSVTNKFCDEFMHIR